MEVVTLTSKCRIILTGKYVIITTITTTTIIIITIENTSKLIIIVIQNSGECIYKPYAIGFLRMYWKCH